MSVAAKNKKIILQEPIKVEDDKGGRAVTGYNSYTVWAEFWKPKVVTADSTGTMLSELTRNIIIWRRSDIRKGWRVLYGSKIFSVEHVYDWEKNETMLVCKEVVR
ncbi:phage head closure protein [Sporomusa malonica]|uniref:Phage head-tail adaptor, putative, SPP1 family n=1 Tax=Sporomusa malonica TaxID=112901 RepID=A0A1W2ARR2_9FIRM|nr:phage head closure protein [Sporomusa malonica]SMC63274.1 phage head-tail adaptor, putative, SPP1 family [Sporomusa malonica]